MVVQIFASVLFEVALALVPRCSLKVEAVDPNSFAWVHQVLAIDSSVVGNERITGSSYVNLLFNCVKGPIVLSVSSGDLLADTGQESLSVEEAGQPVRDGSLFHQPVVEQVVTLLHRAKPAAQSRVQPGDFGSRWIGQEELRYPQVVESLDAFC